MICYFCKLRCKVTLFFRIGQTFQAFLKPAAGLLRSFRGTSSVFSLFQGRAMRHSDLRAEPCRRKIILRPESRCASHCQPATCKCGQTATGNGLFRKPRRAALMAGRTVLRAGTPILTERRSFCKEKMPACRRTLRLAAASPARPTAAAENKLAGGKLPFGKKHYLCKAVKTRRQGTRGAGGRHKKQALQ